MAKCNQLKSVHFEGLNFVTDTQTHMKLPSTIVTINIINNDNILN